MTARALTPSEAAAYLGVTVGTLKVWRRVGKGPPYSCRLGRDPRYNPDHLDKWLWSDDALASNTAEAKAKRAALRSPKDASKGRPRNRSR